MAGYSTQLSIYQDKLDELTDKNNILSELMEDYEIRLKNITISSWQENIL